MIKDKIKYVISLMEEKNDLMVLLTLVICLIISMIATNSILISLFVYFCSVSLYYYHKHKVRVKMESKPFYQELKKIKQEREEKQAKEDAEAVLKMKSVVLKQIGIIEENIKETAKCGGTICVFKFSHGIYESKSYMNERLFYRYSRWIIHELKERGLKVEMHYSFNILDFIKITGW